MNELEQREAVVAEALTWLGTPYHHHARVKGGGADCGLSLAAIYEAAGVMPAVDPGDYTNDWHLHNDGEKYLELVEKNARRIEGPPLPGDIVLFKYGRCISHGAVVIVWPTILHAYAIVGEVVLDDAEKNQELAERLVGFWSPWGRG